MDIPTLMYPRENFLSSFMSSQNYNSVDLSVVTMYATFALSENTVKLGYKKN